MRAAESPNRRPQALRDRRGFDHLVRCLSLPAVPVARYRLASRRTDPHRPRSAARLG